MKVVISAQGPEMDSLVDPRFGRAAWFLCVDTETGSREAARNEQNLNAVQGAGIQSAQNAANLGAEAVLTGHCGPKAFRVLKAAGIKVYVGVEGTVAEALEKLRAGKLQEADGADVEGHW
ncbi:MAG TPA: NifB/NifX family molybdenum-iron cluster-binding protein [Candidatus Brocadiia bacterium]|mgnify:CR=1 FL=1|nr:NifB/NifX family molybdenum-iron cluster-binding protein [Candidatus Brocadiia bacterium]